jgi:VanZ like family
LIGTPDSMVHNRKPKIRSSAGNSPFCLSCALTSPHVSYDGQHTILTSIWFPILWLAVILGVTLVPLEATDGPSPILCVLCADGALADVVLNAVLFLPLGATLSVAGWRPWRTVGLGALLSCGVETAQFVIPGRDPSLSDVLFNTLGMALGIALARSAPTWWQPGPRLADVLAIAGALGATSVLAVTGVLLGPSLPENTYYGEWTQRFGHLEWYGGRVLEASLEGLEIPSGVIARSTEVRQLLLAEATIHVRARAGPRPPGLAPCSASTTNTSARFCFLASTETTSSTGIARVRWPGVSPEPRSGRAAHFVGSPGGTLSPSACAEQARGTACARTRWSTVGLATP